MQCSEWRIPKDIKEIVDEEGEWESEDWSPIRLIIMVDIEYRGRDIPLCWQVEFEPSDTQFEEANRKLEIKGFDADGYGWAKFIQTQMEQYYPEILTEFHFGDSEESTFVAWVKSEESCKKLVSILWGFVRH